MDLLLWRIYFLTHPTGISVNRTGARKCGLTQGGVRRLSCVTLGCLDVMFTSFFRQTFRRQHVGEEPNRTFLDRKNVVVRCEMKIPSLGITVQHHSASLVMPNSYPCDQIFTSRPLKILIFSHEAMRIPGGGGCGQGRDGKSKVN